MNMTNFSLPTFELRTWSVMLSSSNMKWFICPKGKQYWIYFLLLCPSASWGVYSHNWVLSSNAHPEHSSSLSSRGFISMIWVDQMQKTVTLANILAHLPHRVSITTGQFWIEFLLMLQTGERNAGRLLAYTVEKFTIRCRWFYHVLFPCKFETSNIIEGCTFFGCFLLNENLYLDDDTFLRLSDTKRLWKIPSVNILCFVPTNSVHTSLYWCIR